MVRAVISCSASPERYRLLEKGRKGKNAFSRMVRERLENDSCGGTSVKLDLGREFELGPFELEKKTQGWKQLKQSHSRGGKASASGFPAPAGLGPRLYNRTVCGRLERKIVIWQHRRPCSPIRTFGHDSVRNGCSIRFSEGEWCTQGRNRRSLFMTVNTFHVPQLSKYSSPDYTSLLNFRFLYPVAYLTPLLW